LKNGVYIGHVYKPVTAEGIVPMKLEAWVLLFIVFIMHVWFWM